MFNPLFIVKQRSQYVQTQDQIDGLLSEAFVDCPSSVFAYLLEERKKTRATPLSSSPFTSNNLVEINDMKSRELEKLRSEGVCNVLTRFSQSFQIGK